MRRALERFAWRMWRGEAGWAGSVVGVLLLPLEGAWRFATRARNRRHDRKSAWSVEGLTVVSVGNLAVGGTGKTPVAGWIARRLVERGAHPALLLRGYGQDEVALHRSWNPEVRVEAGGDRAASAERARGAGADVAVLDDGFQHRGVARALDVVLLAVEDPLPGPVLPRGPYREPLAALHRADVIVFTRRSGSVEDAEERLAALRRAGVLTESADTACVHLATDSVTPLRDFGASRDRVSSSPESPGPAESPVLQGSHVGVEGRGGVALTAIARPHAFQEAVEALTGAPVELLAHPDHHEYSFDDVLRARRMAADRPIFVTEKDAVKLADRAPELGEAWVVRQRLVWDWGRDDVIRRLEAVLGTRAEDGA